MSTLTLMAGGDIGPVYEPTAQFAELIAPALRRADLRLGQCERVNYTEWVSDEHPHAFRVEGDEVVVDTAI